MTVKVFGIYDVKAAAYMPPFCLAHVGQAVRAFTDLVRDQAQPVSKHPEDYKLYELGSFDDVAGLLTGLAAPKFVVGADEIVSAEVAK